jgi:hypothetical protein
MSLDKASVMQGVSVKKRNWYCILLILANCLLWMSAAEAAITEKALPDSFSDVIDKFSSLEDRSTGTAGNQKAAVYIKEEFERLGFETTGSYRFSVPIMQHE